MSDPRSVRRPLLAGLICLAAAVATGPATAAVMKCTGPGGKLTYTDRTCPRSTEKRQLIRTTPEGGAGQLTAGAGGSPAAASGPAAAGSNGGSPPQPTIVGGPRANAGTDAAANAAAATPSVSGANSDTGQTAVGTGATAPTDVAAPVPATP